MQTTTEVMAETIRVFNPHVAVFPNQIAKLPRPRKRVNDLNSLVPSRSSSEP